MIAPYKRPPKIRPVALVTRAGRVIEGDGTAGSIEDAHPDLVLYGDRDLIIPRVVAGEGEAVCWNDVPVRWEIAGRSVILIGMAIGDTPHALAGLLGWADWLAGYGASPASLGSSARRLLRCVIEGPLFTNYGCPPPLGEVIGGRQTAAMRPGHYGAAEVWDLAAAYATAHAEAIYSGSWVRWANAPADVEGWALFHRARVRVPSGIAHGPLPRRARKPEPLAIRRRFALREYPIGREITGVWCAEELAAAAEIGARVEILDTWANPTDRRPFVPWWAAIRAGRSPRAHPITRRLAKATGNALWGSWVIYGERSRVSYHNGRRRRTIESVPGGPDAAPDLAELVAGRTRARLYRELMVPAGERLVSVHTDGGLVLAEPELPEQPELAGEAPAPWRPAGPGWRLKDRIRQLTFLNPQTYRSWTDHGLAYTVSGVRPEQAPAVFNGLARLILGSAQLPGSTTRQQAIRMVLRAFPGLTSREAEQEVAGWFGATVGEQGIAELRTILGERGK